MLTKEECEQALYTLTRNNGFTNNEDIVAHNMIFDLINEHFDNPPLEFEELKKEFEEL